MATRRKPRRLAALRRRKPKEQEEAAAKEEPRRPWGLEADLVKLDVFGGLKGGCEANCREWDYDVNVNAVGRFRFELSCVVTFFAAEESLVLCGGKHFLLRSALRW